MKHTLYISFHAPDQALFFALFPLEAQCILNWHDGRIIAQPSESAALTAAKINGAVVAIDYDESLHTKLTGMGGSRELSTQDNNLSVSKIGLLEIVTTPSTRFSILVPREDNKSA